MTGRHQLSYVAGISVKVTMFLRAASKSCFLVPYQQSLKSILLIWRQTRKSLAKTLPLEIVCLLGNRRNAKQKQLNVSLRFPTMFSTRILVSTRKRQTMTLNEHVGIFL